MQGGANILAYIEDSHYHQSVNIIVNIHSIANNLQFVKYLTYGRTMSRLSEEQLSLLLLHTEAVNSGVLLRLRKRHGSYLKVYTLFRKGADLKLTDTQYQSIVKRQSLRQRLLEIIDQYHIRLVLHGDPDYPQLLTEIGDPPAVLYVRGRLPWGQMLSIVGSRKHTSYGRQITELIAKHCSLSGLTIVSGLAYGIDGVAHKAAVEQQRPTVGVLACGVEQIYPGSHRGLVEKMIANGGAVISEFPLFTSSYKYNFPIRNRIIAGLSMITVITEAGIGSGALLTAGLANDYGRTVYAVPGDITRPSSAGPNALITAGANMLTDPVQITDCYNVVAVGLEPVHLEPEERTIIAVMEPNGIHLDRLSELLSLDIAELSSKVILLEIKGLVKHEGAGVYRPILREYA
jgi:DNA processing protein